MTEAELEQEGQILRGTVHRVTYRSPETGYAVVQLKVREQTEQVTVVGHGLDVGVGVHLVIRGEYVNHPKFGKQFSAQSTTVIMPSTASGIERYLSSGLIKGIGKRTAERIVEALGDKTLEILANDPQRVAKIPGIGRHKAFVIAQAVTQQKDVQEVMRFLVEHDISPNLAARIYEQYKERAVEILKKDPYLLARQMRGIGFLTADQIAQKLGLAHNAPQRLKAGLYYALEKARDDGHCYLPIDILMKHAGVLLGLGQEQDLSPELEALVQEGFVSRNEDNIYLKRLDLAEDFVARFVADRVGNESTIGIDQSSVKKALMHAAQELKLEFSPEQELAVSWAVQNRLLIITGGPGCGKTTIIRALVSVFSQAGKRMVMAAPTGRAAQRMSQVCTHEASTIHRLLRYDPMSHKFMHGIDHPIQVDGQDVDVVIIDESSMIDIVLAKDLFSAIPRKAVLILVGDKDQLPSVGPGRVFADLISVPQVKTIALSKLFRRAEESTINTIAHMVNSGLVPENPEPDGITKADGYFINKREPAEAQRVIESLVADQITKKFGIARGDIQVMTPSNRGPLGTLELNRLLQNKLNPASSLGPHQVLTVGDNEYRLGDRVCQRVNNYNIHIDGVFNGDLGIIVDVALQDKTIDVEMWDGRLVKYDESSLGQLSLAYAVTVHRSQGSEIPCVVLALHDSHFTLLERQLLYTAVTRAKKLLIVVGSKKALVLAAKRMGSKRRLTNLKSRINQHLPR